MKRVFCLTILMFIAVGVLSCSKPLSEEERVKSVVEDFAASARDKDIKRFLSCVSKSFSADEVDYNGVKGILLAQFLRAEKVSVLVRGVTVEVKGETALADVKAVLISGREVKTIGDVLPEDAAGYRFSIVFKKEDNEWKAVTAKWDNVGASALF